MLPSRGRTFPLRTPFRPAMVAPTPSRDGSRAPQAGRTRLRCAVRSVAQDTLRGDREHGPDLQGDSHSDCGACLGCGAGAPGAAGGGGAPTASSHTVVVGETLWALAYRYYGDPFHWPTIYEANRGEIDDPHWIYPEEQFVIPGAPNQPPRPFPRRSTAPDDPALVGDVAVRTPGSLPETPPAYQGNQRRTRPSLLSQAPDYRTVFYDTTPVGYGAVHSAGRRDWLVVPRDAYYSAEWLAVSAQSAPRLGTVKDFHQILDKGARPAVGEELRPTPHRAPQGSRRLRRRPADRLPGGAGRARNGNHHAPNRAVDRESDGRGRRHRRRDHRVRPRKGR